MSKVKESLFVTLCVKSLHFITKISGNFCFHWIKKNETLTTAWQSPVDGVAIWEEKLSLDAVMYKNTDTNLYERKRTRLRLVQKVGSKEKAVGQINLDLAEIINCQNFDPTLKFEKGPMKGATVEIFLTIKSPQVEEDDSSCFDESVSSLFECSGVLVDEENNMEINSIDFQNTADIPTGSRFMSELEPANSLRNEIEKENTFLRNQLEEMGETIQAMEREIDALRKREKELKEDLYSTHRELKFQTATVITDEKLKSELYDLKNTIEIAQRNLDISREENLDLKKTAKKKEQDYQEVLGILKGSSNKIMQDNGNLRSQIMELEKTMEELRTSWQEAAKIQVLENRTVLEKAEKEKGDKLQTMETLRHTNKMYQEVRRLLEEEKQKTKTLQEINSKLLNKVNIGEKMLAQQMVDKKVLQSHVTALQSPPVPEDAYELEDEALFDPLQLKELGIELDFPDNLNSTACTGEDVDLIHSIENQIYEDASKTPKRSPEIQQIVTDEISKEIENQIAESLLNNL